MEVKTLQHFLYNNHLNKPMKITYRHDDTNRRLEKQIFNRPAIKQRVRSIDDMGTEQDYEYGVCDGLFTLLRWPEDNEPYFMCQVIKIDRSETGAGLICGRATLRKLKPYLMLSLVHEDKEHKNIKHEQRFYKYYKNDFEDDEYIHVDHFSGQTRYDYHNVKDYIVFSPSHCDYYTIS
jgi:hypothetical protein